MNSPKCWWKRNPWPKYLAAVLLAALLSGPARAASGQPARPAASTSATIDTAQAARDKAAVEAMRTTNEAEMQPLPAAPPVVVPASAESVVVPEKGPANIASKSDGNTLTWGLGIIIGGIIGFFIARILTAKSKEMPVALEDQNAQIRRRDHRRGQGSTPASREEQRMSESLNAEFIQRPMRQNMAIPKEPDSGSNEPTASDAKPPTGKPKNRKSVSPMPDKPLESPSLQSINELVDANTTEVSEPLIINPTVSAAHLEFYAPAPDVPNVEHRKLTPNPLPQMPLLIKLAHPEASKADFSFSPQADQSRIIGNGVRELKEFFSFELPPTEQFTTIRNISPGKLERRENAWHVVQKATISLS